jgi:hypothetical protein
MNGTIEGRSQLDRDLVERPERIVLADRIGLARAATTQREAPDRQQ